jgi:hypothetical protein
MDVAIGFAMGFGRCGRWEKAEPAGKIWQNHRTADLVFGWLLYVILCYYMLLSHRFISGITNWISYSHHRFMPCSMASS